MGRNLVLSHNLQKAGYTRCQSRLVGAKRSRPSHRVETKPLRPPERNRSKPRSLFVAETEEFDPTRLSSWPHQKASHGSLSACTYTEEYHALPFPLSCSSVLQSQFPGLLPIFELQPAQGLRRQIRHRRRRQPWDPVLVILNRPRPGPQ